MNKTTSILTIIGPVVIVYFTILNWNVFMLELDVSLGIQVIQLPLISGIFFSGLFLFVLLWINLSVTNTVVNIKPANAYQQLKKNRDTINSEILNKIERLLNSFNELRDKNNLDIKTTSIIKQS